MKTARGERVGERAGRSTIRRRTQRQKPPPAPKHARVGNSDERIPSRKRAVTSNPTPLHTLPPVTRGGGRSAHAECNRECDSSADGPRAARFRERERAPLRD
eukprot:6188370-Pleurochrysis_carterae.AAC.1